MGVSVKSRYWNQSKVEVTGDKGPVSSLPVRRPLGPADRNAVPYVIYGTATIESLAAQVYGRSDVWWQIADASASRFPLDFKPGEKVNIPPRLGIGRVARTRNT